MTLAWMCTHTFPCFAIADCDGEGLILQLLCRPGAHDPVVAKTCDQ